MRKKMTTIDKNKLTGFIDTLLKKIPPSSEKNIKIAFQEFVTAGFEEIIPSPQWCNI